MADDLMLGFGEGFARDDLHSGHLAVAVRSCGQRIRRRDDLRDPSCSFTPQVISMLKILFPTDYSACSRAALGYAISLASESSGEILILHVIEPTSPFLGPDFDAESNPLRETFFEYLKALLANKPQVTFEHRTVVASPVTAIVETAEVETVDLIVMGTTGRTGVKRLVLGSVAEEVVRRAPCPVLTSKEACSELTPHAVQAADLPAWPANELPSEHLAHELTVEVGQSPALALLIRAIQARASDIHFDPVDNDLLVRFRIDGRLQNYCRMDSSVAHGVATQLKVMANLDIADPFHPKEGRMQLPDSMQGIDARVTTIPVSRGEAISIRLHSRDRLVRSLQELGLSDMSLDATRRLLSHGEGVILVTGPTGAGKTTTVYSMLRTLDDGTRNIVSIEDPIELPTPGMRQMGVDVRHGITMTSGLRTLLRLDPDIVFLSEIRDAEAAETAMRAASSGKYVFSTLHTRDVASTVTALRDLHIDSRSLSGNLAGIISQRLLRRLCQECCRRDTPSAAEADLFAKYNVVLPQEIFRPVGCPRCRKTGYFDRIGVFEVVVPEREVVHAIEQGVAEQELRSIIRAQGVRSLEFDTLEKVSQGITSMEEFSALTSIPMVC